MQENLPQAFYGTAVVWPLLCNRLVSTTDNSFGLSDLILPRWFDTHKLHIRLASKDVEFL
jgi:hypothetical protein